MSEEFDKRLLRLQELKIKYDSLIKETNNSCGHIFCNVDWDMEELEEVYELDQLLFLYGER